MSTYQSMWPALPFGLISHYATFVQTSSSLQSINSMRWSVFATNGRKQFHFFVFSQWFVADVGSLFRFLHGPLFRENSANSQVEVHILHCEPLLSYNVSRVRFNIDSSLSHRSFLLADIKRKTWPRIVELFASISSRLQTDAGGLDSSNIITASHLKGVFGQVQFCSFLKVLNKVCSESQNQAINIHHYFLLADI